MSGNLPNNERVEKKCLGPGSHLILFMLRRYLRYVLNAQNSAAHTAHARLSMVTTRWRTRRRYVCSYFYPTLMAPSSFPWVAIGEQTRITTVAAGNARLVMHPSQGGAAQSNSGVFGFFLSWILRTSNRRGSSVSTVVGDYFQAKEEIKETEESRLA